MVKVFFSRQNLTSQALVSHVFATFYNLNNLNFSKNSTGKPYVLGAPNYNFSNTCGGCCLAVSSRDVGIDIESVNRIVPQNIKLKLFSEISPTTPREYIKAWTVKEAFAKYLGKGITALKDIKIFDCGVQYLNQMQHVNIKTFEEQGFFISVAACEKEFEIITLKD